MGDLNELNSTLPVKIVGADSTGAETYFAQVTSFGAQHFSLRNAAGAEVVGQQVMAASVPVTFASNQSALPVSQSGVWNITNISGTISLPTGASTSAKQDTGNTSLASIDAKNPALGQALAAGSVPVVLTALQIAALAPPSNDIIVAHPYLSNAGSPVCSVNASLGTPTNFDWVVPASEEWFVDSIKVFLLDTGTTLPGNFGAISALTNGLMLQMKINGTVYTIDTIKSNFELALCFSNDKMIPPTSGFLESADGWMGEIKMSVPVKLRASTGDFVRVSIRDNLTSIDFLRFKVKAFRGY